jgi:TolA-binding protein
LKRAALAFLIFTSLAACGASTPAYTRSFAEGERAETAGRFAEASLHYDDAARVAPNARERDHASYAAAKMLLQAGDVAGAAPRLEAIASANPPGEHAVLAYYDLTEFKMRHGREPEAWLALEHMVLAYPASALARRAFHRVIAHKDETEGLKASLAYIDAVGAILATSDLGETIAYEHALHLEQLGDHTAARAAFVAVAEKWPYPFGALRDDSLFRASEIDEALGRFPEAIADLKAMLRDREKASTIGTYQRPRYTPAQWRIAVLYRDRLHDRPHAREAFHFLYADFTTALQRDDALWEEASLWAEDNDKTAACARLSTLNKEFPDSRYVPCAIDDCPAIQRASASHAPKTCHAYLRTHPRDPR